MGTESPLSTSTVPENVFRATSTLGLPRLLADLGVSLLVTTYQAGKLIVVRSAEGEIWSLMRTFDRPMGLATKGNRQFALGTRYQIWEFRNAPHLAGRIEPA